MKVKKTKILWIDDEIEMIKPHILFLEEKNFEVTSASNGNDGINLVEEKDFDIVLLDEMMPGLNGLETLTEIKKRNASLPIVMVTKNEEEGLMNKAISQQITDYIIKPINPNQILMSIKKILMSEEIRRDRLGEEYSQFSAWLNQKLFSSPDWNEWIEIYRKIVDWDLKLDSFNYENIIQMHNYEKKNCNVEFSNCVDSKYTNWVNSDEHPIFSHEIVQKFIKPQFSKGKTVYFIVLDCMRLDQYEIMKPILEEFFSIKTNYYFSILPTSTPYSRNAIFSGMLPDKISKIYPQFWKSTKEIETSFNRDEHFFIDEQMKRLRIDFPEGIKYTKVLNPEEGQFILKKIHTHKKDKFVIFVYNFLDLLLHHRSRDEILQEILPNDKALRSLSKIWFLNSSFFKTMQEISKQDAIVVLTTDHGSIKVEHATKVVSERDTSSGLRTKHGKNLSTNERHAYKVSNPVEIGLPRENFVENYIFAREDYYFVFPTDYNEYKNKFKGTYQHGGISMEEMILPISILTPKEK